MTYFTSGLHLGTWESNLPCLLASLRKSFVLKIFEMVTGTNVRRSDTSWISEGRCRANISGKLVLF